MTYKRILLETEGREISLEEIILQNQDELEEICHQKKRLEDAYKSQVKHLDEREKELKTELKSIEAAKKKL